MEYNHLHQHIHKGIRSFTAPHQKTSMHSPHTVRRTYKNRNDTALKGCKLKFPELLLPVQYQEFSRIKNIF